ncbi:hypothetical protein CC1G_11047 [Coprinopsis cinerea okayama7|uniref:Ubiquitin-like protease family profile domain-containing protein n=1 Tax=Coprinopsis cinerea (strain Okayama-7 / 130 / ATCC MYA-4618 / FGSC 9003) TaxID=240176 RepID=A8NIU8_COPC7|nr:hypothetical protein CC1G_11047 [Coprinopsis cinerea okayama7\|eukprot:XP_001834077.2 hypothetical protein CC1G_11047 [Coprinopsis cinerea okayama7\
MPRSPKTPPRPRRRDFIRDRGGLGVATYSPVKKRDAYKTQTLVSYIGFDVERDRLERSLAELKAKAQRLRESRSLARQGMAQTSEPSPISHGSPGTSAQPTTVPLLGTSLDEIEMMVTEETGHRGDDEWVDIDDENEGNEGAGDMNQDEVPGDHMLDDDADDDDDDCSYLRTTLPLLKTQNLYSRWMTRIPSLVPHYLSYLEETTGQSLPALPREIHRRCEDESCPNRALNVVAFTLMGFNELSVFGCLCQEPVEVLVRTGLFPTAPTRPRMAISISLLDLYHSVFEKSSDAIYAFAGAMQNYYEKRGFVLLNRKKEYAQDGFRKPFGLAVQWYDRLQNQVRQRVEAALCKADEVACDYISKNPTMGGTPGHDEATDITRALVDDADSPTEAPDVNPTDTASNPPPSSKTAPGECDRILRDYCPACFGGKEFGIPLDEGGDVVIAIDGNFNHRHNRNVTNCPKFYEPEHFVTKAYVDAIGERMAEARTQPKRRVTSKVPKEAVKACQKSHQAGSGSNVKTSLERFDAGGLMAVVCRHDIPLFLANIDTAGEQQKFAVALIEKVLSHMPAHANLVVLYDVGCVLDRSIQLHPIVSADIAKRLKFATSAMHAYAHQWACQLGYNPRLQDGMALSDGEGVERIWSQLRRLIPIERNCAAEKRIWLIDRQTHYINRMLRDGLGDTIRRRLTKAVVQHEAEALAIIEDVDLSRDELERQWEDQRTSQMSVRSYGTKSAKKELDAIINLQTEMDAIEKNLKAARKALKGSKTQAAKKVGNLASKSAELQEMIDEIYGALDLPVNIPELEGVSYEYLRQLILLRDVKDNIRKRAIGSFFEIDRLDQAVGGRTKLHQATRRSIQRRKPALMRAIDKHNDICATLAQLHKRKWKLPLPQPLPTKLSDLRNSPALLEDVWLSRVPGTMPDWLESADVRKAIRAHLKLKRCREERTRLGREADNLSRWYGRESTAVEIALDLDENSDIKFILLQHRARLAATKQRWINGTNTPIYVQNITAYSNRVVEGVLGRPALPSPLYWLKQVTAGIGPTSQSATPGEEEEEDEDDDGLPQNPGTVDEIGVQDLIDTDDQGEEEEAKEKALGVVLREEWTEPTVSIGPRSIFSSLPEPLVPSPDLPTQTRFFRAQGYPQAILHDFQDADLAILSSKRERLNDVCLNSGAELLRKHFAPLGHTSQCALFTTFALLFVTHHATHERLWRHVRRTEYWRKEVWLLPIHRRYPDEHWVIAILYPAKGEILLFDSLGARKPWKKDLTAIAAFIPRLRLLAAEHEHPFTYTVAQDWATTSHSCGLWVLSVISSIFQGFHRADIGEEELSRFRWQLYSLVMKLPLQDPART